MYTKQPLINKKKISFFQPQIPLRLPCYDLTPVTGDMLTFTSSANCFYTIAVVLLTQLLAQFVR